ncbi:MAG: dCMP deaminase family protein [Clostridia bacterium]|nr:dCMP deaminase family protein [Clostridia bacterium]
MRPEWDEYFMQIAEVVKTRSTCLRRQVGAVIVKDHRILATGYNGAPSNMAHCSTCVREEMNVPSGERHELCRGMHAEQNAIVQAAKYGINISNATLYCTTQPCVICTKMIVNAGINKVIYKGEYPDRLALHMMEEAKIVIESYGI